MASILPVHTPHAVSYIFPKASWVCLLSALGQCTSGHSSLSGDTTSHAAAGIQPTNLLLTYHII